MLYAKNNIFTKNLTYRDRIEKSLEISEFKQKLNFDEKIEEI
jgi:hypothetical protein